jgi:Calcium binding
MAQADACARVIRGAVREQGRNLAVHLSQLVAIHADESTVEASSNWHYRVAARLLLLGQIAPALSLRSLADSTQFK